MEQADLGYIDKKIKQMQLYVSAYGSQKLLEEEFSCEEHTKLKYSKEIISPEPGLMMYYYRLSKPAKFFTSERPDYVKVWFGKSNKFLKAVRENGRFTYIIYYKYFDTLQIKFKFERNSLREVQMCEYDENTRLISSVTNFLFFSTKDDNDNKDIMWSIDSVDGEIYSYENGKFSETFKYWLAFNSPYHYDTPAERAAHLLSPVNIIGFVTQIYKLQYSENRVNVYNPLFNMYKPHNRELCNVQEVKSDKLYGYCERDFSKLHCYDTYFFGTV